MRDANICVWDNGDLGDTHPKIPNACDFSLETYCGISAKQKAANSMVASNKCYSTSMFAYGAFREEYLCAIGGGGGDALGRKRLKFPCQKGNSSSSSVSSEKANEDNS